MIGGRKTIRGIVFADHGRSAGSSDSGDPAKPGKDPGDLSSRERAQRREDAPLVRTDRLDHVHLYVHDRPGAVAWYRRVLGLVPYGKWSASDDPDHPVFLAPATGGHHCVSIFTGDRPTGGDRTVAFHTSARALLGFAAALPDDDVAALDGSPLTAADHNDYGMAITFNFRDPAGNHLELVTYDHETARAGLKG